MIYKDKEFLTLDLGNNSVLLQTSENDKCGTKVVDNNDSYFISYYLFILKCSNE